MSRELPMPLRWLLFVVLPALALVMALGCADHRARGDRIVWRAPDGRCVHLSYDQRTVYLHAVPPVSVELVVKE